MALNKTDKSFKTLINKRFTTPDRKFYQEIGKDTLNTHMREVWMNTIPEDSASATIQGYAAYYEQWILTSDPTYADQTFYFISGSGFTPGTDSINSGWLVNEASQSFFIGDFISDKYGSSYEVKLYDASGSQLFKTDAINWIFDYKTGVLHVADPGAYPTPYKVTVFKYTGLTLADPGAIPSGSISGSVSNWTGSVDGSISRYSAVKITGSLDVTKNVNAISASFGNIFDDGIVWIGQNDTQLLVAQTQENRFVGDFQQIDGFLVNTVSRPVLRAFRNNRDSSEVVFTFPVFTIRNQDSETTSSCFNIEVKPYVGGGTIWDVFSVDYHGNTFVSGNISVSPLATVDGVDISEFSSSVATQIANLETGSGQWTVELDGSISRNSDVRITGSLYISGSDNRLYGTASWVETSSQAVSSSYAVTSSYAESVAPGIGGLWTGSDGYIERFGTVKVSGSMYYRQGDRIYFGDGDTYIHESVDDQVQFVFSGGTIELTAFSLSFVGFNTPAFGNVTATATVPNIVPRIADIDTGLGHAAEDILSLIAGGTNILNVVYASNTGSVGIGTTSPVSLVGPGGLHVWNNISASNLYWESTDLTSFSSSVATTLTTLNTITGSYWTGSVDGSISRSSDVQIIGDVDINGGLNISQSQYGNAITIDTDRYINFVGGANTGWLMGQVSSPTNHMIVEFSKMGSNIGYFVFSRGTEDKTNVIIYSGSLVINKDQTDYNPSNVFEVYGDSFMSGSIEVPPNATVDGVDISEFSSSVAQQIVNIETGSSIWSLEDDGSISRDSDIRITGSTYIESGVTTGLQLVRGSGFNNKIELVIGTGAAAFDLYDGDNNLFEIVAQNTIHQIYSVNILQIHSDMFLRIGDNQSHVTQITGSTNVSGNIEMIPLATVDGVDISEFSSSVATNLTTLNAITSSYWTGSEDGSISRLSDAKITGSLYFTGSKWEDRIVLPDSQFIKLGDDWKFSSIDSNDEFYIEYNKAGSNVGIFGLQPGIKDKIYLTLYSGSVNINTSGIAKAETNGIVLNVYGQSLLYGNVDVRSNILMQGGKTVDGVDISEFSSSVATAINEINAGSGSRWTGSEDGHISRESDVQITGSLGVSNTITGFTASIGSTHGLVQINPSSTYVARAYSSQNPFVLDVLQEGTIFSPTTISRPAFRAFRSNTSGDVSTYSEAVIVIRNSDDATTSDSFKIQSGNSPITRFLVDYWGNTHVSGNITLSTGSTVDGVDIDVFSSSVAQQIYNLETGSTPWTTEQDNSISRNSDVRITGSLDINGNITGEITRTNLSYKSTMSADYSAIIGGAFNEMVGASNNYNIILGGRYNNFVNNNTDFAGILAGELNTIAADWSVVLGGYDNTMNGELSAILGGQENKIDWDAIQGVILGGVGLINSGSSQVVLGEWNKKGNTSDIFVIGNGTTDLNRSDSFTITPGGDLTLSGSITLSLSETVDGVDISSFSSSVEQRITNAETGSALWSLEQDGSIARNSNVKMTGSVYINSSTFPALTIRELATSYYLQFYVDTPNVAGIAFNDAAGTPAIENNVTAFTIYGGGAGKLIRIYGDTSDVKIGNLLSNKIMITGSVNITGSTAISGNLDVSESGSFSYLSVNDSVIVELITANTGSFDLLDVAVSASFQDYVEVDGFMHVDGGTW